MESTRPRTVQARHQYHVQKRSACPPRRPALAIRAIRPTVNILKERAPSEPAAEHSRLPQPPRGGAPANLLPTRLLPSRSCGVRRRCQFGALMQPSRSGSPRLVWPEPSLWVHSVEMLATPIRVRPTAEITSASPVGVGRIGAVLLLTEQKYRPGAKRVAVALESDLMRMAIRSRRARRRKAVRYSALEVRRHIGSGLLHDLSNSLSR